ncbi:MAG: hypothetical protein F6J95_023945 [Leptolyngbya sp. SIO1E4]|nr:hypothetical protein [Leptolyngbya sp. SIO1E4]
MNSTNLAKQIASYIQAQPEATTELLQVLAALAVARLNAEDLRTLSNQVPDLDPMGNTIRGSLRSLARERESLNSYSLGGK